MLRVIWPNRSKNAGFPPAFFLFQSISNAFGLLSFRETQSHQAAGEEPGDAGLGDIDVEVAAGTANGYDVEVYPEIACRFGINGPPLRIFATRSLPCCPNP